MKIGGDKIRTLAWGVVLGVAGFGVAGFGSGWLVTDGNRDQQVQAAQVQGQAEVCASLAMAHRTSTGDQTTLIGYQAREARDALAKRFAVILAGESEASRDVLRACSDLLAKGAV